MIKMSESTTEIFKAMAEFQQKLKQPLKDANNPFFKSQYVPLENVVEAITEAANGLGLSYTQCGTWNETTGNVSVGTIVMHSSGEYLEYEPLVLKPESQKPQAVGSAITYAKRYALSAVFGITSDKDDDGNEANGNGKQVQKNNVTQTQPKKKAQPKDDTHAQALEKWKELIDLGATKQALTDLVCSHFSVGVVSDVPSDKLLAYLTALEQTKRKNMQKQEDF